MEALVLESEVVEAGAEADAADDRRRLIRVLQIRVLIDGLSTPKRSSVAIRLQTQTYAKKVHRKVRNVKLHEQNVPNNTLTFIRIENLRI